MPKHPKLNYISHSVDLKALSLPSVRSQLPLYRFPNDSWRQKIIKGYLPMFSFDREKGFQINWTPPPKSTSPWRSMSFEDAIALTDLQIIEAYCIPGKLLN